MPIYLVRGSGGVKYHQTILYKKVSIVNDIVYIVVRRFECIPKHPDNLDLRVTERREVHGFLHLLRVVSLSMCV